MWISLPSLTRGFAGLLAACLLAACFPRGFDAGRVEEAADRLGYKQGYALAVWQDSLLARLSRGDSIPAPDFEALRNNPWVEAAKTLSPGNLVIRQWALTDLVSGSPDNAERLLEMTDLLAPDSGGRLWLEGYGYWLYTREVLEPWTLRFIGRPAAVRVRALMRAVDSCFAVTAYEREGAWYPAPFGDLRDLPLGEPAASLRNARGDAEPGSCGFVRVEAAGDTVRYVIDARPVGLNTHIPHEPVRVVVHEGMPKGFSFYEGYDRKYADSTEALRDMLRPERIRSIRELKLRERFGR